MDIISINNLKISYGKNLVLDIPQMHIKKGMSVGIFGANGSGKSTLIKCVSNLLPYKGQVLINGIDIKENASPLSKIGILIEEPALIGSMSGRENIKYFSKEFSSMMEYSKILGVNDILDIKARKYSMGMKQKIAILLACVKGKDIILLDEPFNFLDIISIEKVINLLLKCCKNGSTVILTSHQLEISQRAVDMYYLLKNKQIYNCTAPQKGNGNKYLIEFFFKDDAESAKELLINQNFECIQNEFYIKVNIRDYNIFSILQLLNNYQIKSFEDITYSVKEAYLAMEN